MNKFVLKIKGLILLSRQYIILLYAVCYDNIRFCQHALLGLSHYRIRRNQLESQIIKLYHVIEKGLAMRDFRPNFGKERLLRLIQLMKKHLATGGSIDNLHFSTALRCLEEYRRKHHEMGICVDDVVSSNIRLEMTGSSTLLLNAPEAGVHVTLPEVFFAEANAPFGKFAKSRRSWRDFNPDHPVPRILIEEAVKIAIHSPSVCNRQAWKVHAYFDRATIDRLLGHQNGNRGFGHRIPCLLIVTMDLQCFDGVIERYQHWIDGGMFGMNLLLALHHLCLGAVPLNWSVLPHEDKGLRKDGEIPNSESIIMLIGTGKPDLPAAIPVSQRRSLNEVLHLH